jgi:RNA-directed DNA polymerase
VHEDVPMSRVTRQTPEQSGRAEAARGEAARDAVSDETPDPRRDTEGTGSGLLDAVLTRENLQHAWKRVKANKGSAGADGLDIGQTARHLKTAWPEIRERLLRGTYRPSPVRRVTIPKPDGGERELGIPTVTDRLIQQALLQVLQPMLDPTFSEHSYGFRPGRRAHDAVMAAQAFVVSGRRVVVDVDLEKFFDRVNHDILMDRLRRRTGDAAILRLIRAYLDAGIMCDGVVAERTRGTPQGGPLSPLLANVLLDEVDRELERRGHCFARYADDCNVYVRSVKAGERVMTLLRRLYAKLRLTVNETKSAVASAFGRKFLGFRLLKTAAGAIRLLVADKPLAAFKHRVRRLTQRNAGRSLADVIEELRPYLLGWKAYFGLVQPSTFLLPLDRWIRHRLRALQLKLWKHGTRAFLALKALGASYSEARGIAAKMRHWWRASDGRMNNLLSPAYFDRLGLPRLS